MIAVDTSILVYAHRPDSPPHAGAAAELAALVGTPGPWAVAWPCVHEFLAVVTSVMVFPEPTPLPRAMEQGDAWRESGAVLLAETVGHWDRLAELIIASGVTGPKIHDARIAGRCALTTASTRCGPVIATSPGSGAAGRNPLVNPRRRSR